MMELFNQYLVTNFQPLIKTLLRISKTSTTFIPILQKRCMLRILLKDMKTRLAPLQSMGKRSFRAHGTSRSRPGISKTRKCIATLEGHADSVYSLTVSGQTLFSVSRDNTIKAWDLTSNYSTIFEEFAQLLEKATPQTTQWILERFSKMPIRARKTICATLHATLDQVARANVASFARIALDEPIERSANPEAIFYDKSKYRVATSAQKVQAIMDYLKQKNSGAGSSSTRKRTYDTAFGTAVTAPPHSLNKNSS